MSLRSQCAASAWLDVPPALELRTSRPPIATISGGTTRLLYIRSFSAPIF